MTESSVQLKYALSLYKIHFHELLMKTLQNSTKFKKKPAKHTNQSLYQKFISIDLKWTINCLVFQLAEFLKVIGKEQ